MSDRGPCSVYASVLWLLTALFFLRVFAQALTAVMSVPFLPSMDEWVKPSASPFSTSGLIPYPLLLAAQIVILVVQVLVCRDITRGQGYFASLSARTGRILVGLSAVYAAAMVARYLVTMAWHPERRWFGHTVPIALHFVLAGFLFTLGHYRGGGGMTRTGREHG